MHLFHITTPEEEIEYLKRIQNLNRRLEAKYTNTFLSNHDVQKRYETVFQPITKPLNESLEQQKKLQQQQITKPIKKESSIEDVKDYDDGIDAVDDDEKKTEINIHQYLRNIDSYGIRDKYFGIGPGKKGEYRYLGNTIEVNEGSMKILSPSALKQTVEIPSKMIWDMVVLEHPFYQPNHKQLKTYGNILLANGFPQWLKSKRNTQTKKAMLKCEKYNNIILPALGAVVGEKQGKGLYYTRHSPHYYRKKVEKTFKKGRGIKRRNNNVEFFPADKKTLLNKLVYLLGEYHSGNNRSLRKEIVPIIQYLKAHNSLPQKFSTKHMNWIYD